jgi:5'-3' exonuclease
MKGCESWRWRYEKEGAPLMKDIERREVKVKRSEEMREREQLEYVMPKGEEREMSWEYKRYNWEIKIKKGGL